MLNNDGYILHLLLFCFPNLVQFPFLSIPTLTAQARPSHFAPGMSFPLLKNPSVTPRCLRHKVQPPSPGIPTLTWCHTLSSASAEVLAVSRIRRALFGPLPALCPLLKMPIRPLSWASPPRDACLISQATVTVSSPSSHTCANSVAVLTAVYFPVLFTSVQLLEGGSQNGIVRYPSETLPLDIPSGRGE